MRITTWTPKWSVKRANLPPEPGKEPKDPEITPSVQKTIHTRAAANVPEQGEYPTGTQIDHWCPYIHYEANKNLGDLKTMTEEAFAKIVANEVGVVEGLAQFWDDWHASGGDVLVGETQEIYSKWIAANAIWEDPKSTQAPEARRSERPLPPAKEAQAP